MKASIFIDRNGYEKISSAIENAEKITGSELVVHISDKSDNYKEAYWESGAFFMILFLFIIFLTGFFKPDFLKLNNYPALLLLAVAGFSFPAGAAAAMIFAPYRRALIGRESMDYYTGLKAHEAFLHHEVFNTRKRTGILIYLSLFERSAVILGDTFINTMVSREEWDEIISVITSGLRSKRKEEAIVKSIEMCGVLLRNSGIVKEDDDTDELSDEVRIGG